MGLLHRGATHEGLLVLGGSGDGVRISALGEKVFITGKRGATGKNFLGPGAFALSSVLCDCWCALGEFVFG